MHIKINTPLGKAGVLLEFVPNGKVLVVTAVFDDAANIDNWAKNKKSSQNLGIEPDGYQNRLLSNSSIINSIKEKLGIVNSGNSNYNQIAEIGARTALHDKFERAKTLIAESV